LHLVIGKLVGIGWQSYLNTFLHPLNILVGITITELYDSIQRNRSILESTEIRLLYQQLQTENLGGHLKITTRSV